MKKVLHAVSIAVLPAIMLLLFAACSATENHQEPAAADQGDQGSEAAEDAGAEDVSYIDTETNYQLAWGTASTTGAVYPMGAALAGIVTKYYPNVNISVEATGGSVENARLIYSGDVELGVLQGTTAYQAYTGTVNYDTYQNVLALMQSHSTVVQIVVRSDANIQGIADLAGKKVGVGPAGSGTEQSVGEIFPLLGLTYDDFDEQFLSFTEAIQAMQDGDIDAAVFGANPPTPAVMELTTSTDIDILSLSDEQVDMITEAYPYFYRHVIAPDTYEGIDYEVVSISDRTIFAISADMPDSLAYMLLDAWFSHAEEANAAQGTVDFTKAADRAQVGIPLHPGAMAWYDEHGIPYPTEFPFAVY